MVRLSACLLLAIDAYYTALNAGDLEAALDLLDTTDGRLKARLPLAVDGLHSGSSTNAH